MIVYRRRRMGAPDHITPSKQGMTREHNLNALDVNIGARSIASPPPEKVEDRSIFTSENPENSESNFRSSLSGSPLLPLSTRNLDNLNQDDVRVQMGRMKATIGRMAEHIHHLESQLDWTGDGDSDTPPPTYVSS